MREQSILTSGHVELCAAPVQTKWSDLQAAWQQGFALSFGLMASTFGKTIPHYVKRIFHISHYVNTINTLIHIYLNIVVIVVMWSECWKIAGSQPGHYPTTTINTPSAISANRGGFRHV